MKIKLSNKSLRIRLSRSEMEQFSKKGFLEDQTVFGVNKLGYELNRIKSQDKLTADFNNEVIIMYVPNDYVNEMMTTDKVGFEDTYDFDGLTSLKLVFEKDLKCVGKEGEDQGDRFENTKKAC